MKRLCLSPRTVVLAAILVSGGAVLRAQELLPEAVAQTSENRLPGSTLPAKSAPSGNGIGQEKKIGGASEQSKVVRLIGQLAATSFAERQTATRELLTIGIGATPELEKAAATGAAETRERAVRLLDIIRDKEFRSRLTLLEQMNTPEAAGQLAEWDRFRELAGASPDAIRVFAEIQRAEPALNALRLFSPAMLPEALEQRSSELAKRFDGRIEEPFPASSYAALLLLASNPAARLPRGTSTNISAALADERLSQLLQDGVRKDIFRGLVSNWIRRPGIASERPLLFAVRHQLPAGRDVARRVIASRSNRPDMIVAILSLGRLGEESDLERLESLMEVETVLWPLRNQPVDRRQPDGAVRNTNYNVQTRDVALVVAAHLRGREPAEFGMKAVSSDETVFAVESLGFESAELRTAAFTAYRAAFPD